MNGTYTAFNLKEFIVPDSLGGWLHWLLAVLHPIQHIGKGFRDVYIHTHIWKTISVDQAHTHSQLFASCGHMPDLKSLAKCVKDQLI